MDRNRSVLIHEAGHLKIGHDLQIKMEEMKIWRDPDYNELVGEITFERYPWPPKIVDRADKRELSRLFEKHLNYLSLYSAGYIAEFMFEGEKDFFYINGKKLFGPKGNREGQIIYSLSQCVREETFVHLLKVTEKHLKDFWGQIVVLADYLDTHRELKRGYPSIMSQEAEAQVPDHDAWPLILFMSKKLYPRENEEKGKASV